MNYLNPLRRKLGVMTLLMACVFTAGWVKSHFDYGAIKLFVINRDRAVLDTNLSSLNGWLELRFEDASQSRAASLAWPAPIFRIRLPYYIIVVPLTLLSAYLLLSKPRTAERVESPITTAT